MKAKTRSIIEAVRSKLATVTAGPDYIHNIYKIEGGQRDFDTSELAQGVCVCVAFAGSNLESKLPNGPQQVSTLAIAVEAHKYKDPLQDIQAEGLDLLADIEKALLGSTAYLTQKYVRHGGILIESEEIGISNDGSAIVATSIITIPYIKQYAQPHEE